MLRLLKGGQSLLNSQQSLLNSQRSAERARFRTNSNHFNRDRVELSQISLTFNLEKLMANHIGGGMRLCEQRTNRCSAQGQTMDPMATLTGSQRRSG